MSMSTLRKALELCREYGSPPFIGGGEPTLHPRFEQILLETLAYSDPEIGGVGIITNGSIPRRAMLIARLTKVDIISGELSQDEYHDPIPPEVVHMFSELGKEKKYSQTIRDTSVGGTKECLPHGRGVELLGLPYHTPNNDIEEDFRTDADCPGYGWMVLPDGKVVQCGCEDSPIIGDVYSGVNSPTQECCRSDDFRELCLEGGLENLIR